MPPESADEAGMACLGRDGRRKLVLGPVGQIDVVAHAAGRYRMSRDRRRSARTLPPVWHAGQYVTSWDS